MLVSGQGEEGITPIHEITAKQGVRVHDGRLSADDRPSMQMNYKEDLKGEATLTQRGSVYQGRVLLCKKRVTKPRACLRFGYSGMKPKL